MGWNISNRFTAVLYQIRKLYRSAWKRFHFSLLVSSSLLDFHVWWKILKYDYINSRVDVFIGIQALSLYYWMHTTLSSFRLIFSDYSYISEEIFFILFSLFHVIRAILVSIQFLQKVLKICSEFGWKIELSGALNCIRCSSWIVFLEIKLILDKKKHMRWE